MENHLSNTHYHRRLNLAVVGIDGQMADDTVEGGFDDTNESVSESTKVSFICASHESGLIDGFTDAKSGKNIGDMPMGADLNK
jgi:hypothetical protein